VSSPNTEITGPLRRLPVFAQDLLTGGRQKKDTGPGEASCTKHQYASGALAAGVLVSGFHSHSLSCKNGDVLNVRSSELSILLQVIWCSECECAICWSLMTRAESPRTLFELLYCYFPEPEVPMRVVYDNGCNLLAYALNRDPEWTKKSLHVYIDALHKKGHVKCADGLDTGACLHAAPLCAG
jgi:hypothetical protein